MRYRVKIPPCLHSCRRVSPNAWTLRSGREQIFAACRSHDRVGPRGDVWLNLVSRRPWGLTRCSRLINSRAVSFVQLDVPELGTLVSYIVIARYFGREVQVPLRRRKRRSSPRRSEIVINRSWGSRRQCVHVGKPILLRRTDLDSRLSVMVLGVVSHRRGSRNVFLLHNCSADGLLWRSCMGRQKRHVCVIAAWT